MGKRKIWCYVPGCPSLPKNNPELSFHLFPPAGRNKVYCIKENGNRELVDVRKVWITKLNVEEPIKSYMCVCSLHFTESDYFDRHRKKTKRLKKTAIPSENIPVMNLQASSSNLRSSGRVRTKRPKRPQEKKEIIFSELLYDEADNVSQPCEGRVETPKCKELEAAETLLSLFHKQTQYTSPKSDSDFAAQVNMRTKITLCNLIKSNGALASLTGLSNFSLLNLIVKEVMNINKSER